MSQVSKPNSGGGVIPPQVPEEFITDDGTAIPAANILNINGATTTSDNDNGIQTQANPNLSNNLEVVLTNRLLGTATSTNGSTEDLITYALGAIDASYRFQFLIAARDTATNNSAGYTMFASAKTDGASASVIAVPFTDNDEDPALLTATIDFIASGNNVSLQVTGVSGQTITYKAVGSYVVV